MDTVNPMGCPPPYECCCRVARAAAAEQTRELLLRERDRLDQEIRRVGQVRNRIRS